VSKGASYISRFAYGRYESCYHKSHSRKTAGQSRDKFGPKFFGGAYFSHQNRNLPLMCGPGPNWGRVMWKWNLWTEVQENAQAPGDFPSISLRLSYHSHGTRFLSCTVLLLFIFLWAKMIFWSDSVPDFTISPLRLSKLFLKLSCTTCFQMVVPLYQASLPLWWQYYWSQNRKRSPNPRRKRSVRGRRWTACKSQASQRHPSTAAKEGGWKTVGCSCVSIPRKGRAYYRMVQRFIVFGIECRGYGPLGLWVSS
jgi:hypothetical protein